MTRSLADVVDLVGADRWQAACAAAVTETRRSNYGSKGGSWHGSGLDQVPWDLQDFIWDETRLPIDNFRLMQAVVGQMPTYAYLLQFTFNLERFSAAERLEIWQWTRNCLANRASPVAVPVAYWLWCDVFESGREPERVAIAREAFVELTNDIAQHSVLEVVLENSGPAPWDLKAVLYDKLVHDSHWHPWIFESLLRSAGDVYGYLDAASARKYIAKLRIPGREDDLEKFDQALMNPIPKQFPQTLSDAIRAEQKSA